MSSSLDSCCKLSLMLSTVACDSSGKNFASFGNISSQLADILVINCCYFICTALANAFFSATTFSNHDSKSSFFKFLEGEIIIFDAFINGIEAIGRGSLLGRGCGCSRCCIFVAFKGSLAFRKVLFLSHNIRTPAFFALVIIPAAYLQPTDNADHLTFFEVFFRKLTGFAECNASDEVGILLALTFETAVDRQSVSGYGLGFGSLGICHLRISYQSSHQNHYVHNLTSFNPLD